MEKIQEKFEISGDMTSQYPTMDEDRNLNRLKLKRQIEIPKVEKYSWVLERLFSYGGESCFVIGNEVFSFAGLLGQISQWQKELDRMGIKPGQIIGLVVQEKFHCLALFLTMLLNRNVIVPLADDVTDSEEKWKVSGVEYYFDSPSNKWIKIPDAVCPDLIEELRQEQDGGVVIFTSGTTGKSKAALLQTAYILEKIRESEKGMEKPYFSQTGSYWGYQYPAVYLVKWRLYCLLKGTFG